MSARSAEGEAHGDAAGVGSIAGEHDGGEIGAEEDDEDESGDAKESPAAATTSEDVMLFSAPRRSAGPCRD
ncbi:MAG: hypothetical protein WBE63_08750, partial [Acidobacteriaceae bacterium]